MSENMMSMKAKEIRTIGIFTGKQPMISKKNTYSIKRTFTGITELDIDSLTIILRRALIKLL